MADGENLYISNHIILFVITFLIVYYFKVENDRQEQLLNIKNKSLAEEKEKSDDLLLNILPYETAEELKATGSAKAKSFELVTILFTDFKHFTTLAERLSPADLVKEIDECFSAFDAIIENHGIEKIKTIAYFTAAFHSGCGVHRIAPDVIRKFFCAYNSCNYRPAMYAYAHLEKKLVITLLRFFTQLHELPDLQGCIYSINRIGCIGVG